MTGGRRVGLGSFALGMLACLAASWLLAAAPAQAGPAHFAYSLCDARLPGGGEPRLTFGPDAGGTVGPFDSCAQSNGSVYLYQLTHTGPGAATLDVAVPPTPGGWVETETLSAGSYRLGPGAERSYVHDEGWPVPNAGEQTRTFFEHAGPEGGPGTGNFRVTLSCSASYAPGCEGGGGIYVRYIDALEVDPNPPTLVAPSGSLLGPGVLRGHQQLSAAATDLGGGVRDLEVLVNGALAASPQTASCAVAWIANSSYNGLTATSSSPCPPTLGADWTLDTASPPFRRGTNQVQVCASDFATQGEANRTCSAPQPIKVDDSCQESEVAGGASLSARLPSAAGDRVTLPFGGSARISGTLTDAAGSPVAGATICIETAMERPRARRIPVGVAQTNAAGRFTYALAPGPNRQVSVGYRHDSFQLTRALAVRTHARPSLTVGPQRLRNGGRVKLRGGLPGPDAGGRVVVLQASVVGSHRWITFRKATSGHRGVFKASYRFTSTTRRTTYRFRALVPPQAGYPWKQGASKPAAVVVTR